ncbi:MAG: hypothetical protein A2068_05830 [Ignavibacteria bacterium GWB2_35_6b]|nr:MAG: hypothetical protein A2068_05830 [Ignavibacteria bacterium GWB2_35_6b]
MKRELSILIFVLLSFTQTVYSQNDFPGRGNFHPDSLVEVTVTGTVIIDTTYLNPVYFLDEDGDMVSDYHLNFGPWWYNPDSSAAVRPNDGETVTVTGGMHVSQFQNYDIIIVYEINGEFWREPLEPYWNNFTRHHRRLVDRHMACNTSVPYWNRDSLVTVTLTGTVMVDTTFYINHYYFDIDADQTPDYFLNFGPYWYEPSSGAVKPNDGDIVTVTGGELTRDSLSIIIVYEIDGLIWRDSTNFNANLRRGWLRENMNDSTWFNNPYDPQTRMRFNSGWRMGGHQGGMFDSLYCRILEVYPENMPNLNRQRIFAGFEIGIFDPNGMNNMRSSHCGGRMSFGSSVALQLHYSHKQLENYGINENSICAKYWDDSQDEWIIVDNAVIDYENNTVTFSNTEVSSYVILAENEVTAVNDISSNLDNNFKLFQNYPNPFNPSTTIGFSLPVNDYVKLSIYDLLGREVKVLINKNLTAGNHSIIFDASGLSSGIYFYQLKAGKTNLIKKLNLLK